MYALALSEGAESIPVDEVCSDNNNEVLGAISADGMPLTRDDTLDVDNDALDTGEDVVDKDDLETVVNTKEANSGKLVDKDFNDGNDDVEGLVEESYPFSDPFGGVIAPQGYVYMGKLAFICFGPTLKYFTGMLVMGGQVDQMVQEKKDGSRKVQRKVNRACQP